MVVDVVDAVDLVDVVVVDVVFVAVADADAYDVAVPFVDVV